MTFTGTKNAIDDILKLLNLSLLKKHEMYSIRLIYVSACIKIKFEHRFSLADHRHKIDSIIKKEKIKYYVRAKLRHFQEKYIVTCDPK